MYNQNVISTSIDFVKEKLKGDSSGHDWWHIQRVLTLSRKIHQTEGGDLFVIELAALLHDIADWKFNENEKTGSDIVSKWLSSQKVDKSIIDQVLHIIENISYKGEAENNKIQSIEGKIVQDADRLDAIGAIGVARTFAFGGYKGNELHNPEQKPVSGMTFDQYKKSNGTTINHFYEKLLLLKDRMNTPTGKLIANSRHQYMVDFLERFYNEWEGKK